MLVHGGRDQFVSPQHVDRLLPQLRAGVPHETLLIPYGQHGFDYVVGGLSGQIVESALLTFLRADEPPPRPKAPTPLGIVNSPPPAPSRPRRPPTPPPLRPIDSGTLTGSRAPAMGLRRGTRLRPDAIDSGTLTGSRTPMTGTRLVPTRLTADPDRADPMGLRRLPPSRRD